MVCTQTTIPSTTTIKKIAVPALGLNTFYLHVHKKRTYLRRVGFVVDVVCLEWQANKIEKLIQSDSQSASSVLKLKQTKG